MLRYREGARQRRQVPGAVAYRLTRLNFVGYAPGPDVADVSSLMSGRPNLSGFEMPHSVYKDVTVSIRQARWPRKYLGGGTKYGVPCPEPGLLELVDEADKIDITSHEI